MAFVSVVVLLLLLLLLLTRPRRQQNPGFVCCFLCQCRQKGKGDEETNQ
jgi:hypothetical protein